MQTSDDSQLIALPKVISKKIPDYTQLRPLFGWIKPETIAKPSSSQRNMHVFQLELY
jgi:hypothetical protein